MFDALRLIDFHSLVHRPNTFTKTLSKCSFYALLQPLQAVIHGRFVLTRTQKRTPVDLAGCKGARHVVHLPDDFVD